MHSYQLLLDGDFGGLQNKKSSKEVMGQRFKKLKKRSPRNTLKNKMTNLISSDEWKTEEERLTPSSHNVVFSDDLYSVCVNQAEGADDEKHKSDDFSRNRNEKKVDLITSKGRNGASQRGGGGGSLIEHPHSTEAKSSTTNMDGEIIDLYKRTLRFMDYRRLKRTFHGVRRPVPKKRIILLFVLNLLALALNFISVDEASDSYLVYFRISTDFWKIVSWLSGILASIVLYLLFARWQSTLGINWAMYSAYILLILIFVMLLMSRTSSAQSSGNLNDKFVLLLVCLGIQMSVISAVKFVVSVGPLLAIRGRWFSCYEDFRLISVRKRSVTFTRISDSFGMCGNNLCCLCLWFFKCCYRSFKKRYDKSRTARLEGLVTVATANTEKVILPFTHQIRYKGQTDSCSRPHGFGEWLEDHPYGERLQGYWWHGYPIAPFISQEVGSGSTIVCTRVAFFASASDDDKVLPKIGVSMSELSVSGHFFNNFPTTYFLSPSASEYSDLHEWDGNMKNIPINHLLKANANEVSSTSLDWCFRMLEVQARNPFTVNEEETSVMVHFDRFSECLRVNGYRHDSGVAGKSLKIKQVNISLAFTPKDMSRVIGRTLFLDQQEKSNSQESEDLAADEEFDDMGKEMLIPSWSRKSMLAPVSENKKSSSSSTSSSDSEKKNTLRGDPLSISIPMKSLDTSDCTPVVSADNEAKQFLDSWAEGEIQDEHTPGGKPAARVFKGSGTLGSFIERLPSRVRVHNVVNALAASSKKLDFSIHDSTQNEPVTVADVFKDEDEWEKYQHKKKRKAHIVVKDWHPTAISSLPTVIPEEVIVFTHGYNVTLDQGCAQLSHLIGFSRIPAYIHPILFSWNGRRGGALSPFLYPIAKNISQNDQVGNDFAHLLESLANSGVLRVHLLSHSAGARAFMNGMNCCFRKGFLEESPLVVDYEDSSERHGLYERKTSLTEQACTGKRRLRVQTIIFINPDYPVNIFLQKDFWNLRSLCSNISIYGDTRDQVLSFAQVWNGERCLGRNLFDLCLPLSAVEHFLSSKGCDKPASTFDDTVEGVGTPYNEGVNGNFVTSSSGIMKDTPRAPSSATLQLPDPLPTFKVPRKKGKLHVLEEDTSNSMKHNPLDASPPSSSVLKPRMVSLERKSDTSEHASYVRKRSILSFLREYSERSDKLSAMLENEEKFVYDPETPRHGTTSRDIWIDVDVIDTTFVETHTDFLKHCLYQMSREIIDDIRDIIVNGSRARERIVRLDRRRGNVFAFRVAPANVKTLF